MAERYDAVADDDGVVYVAGSLDDVDDSVVELRTHAARRSCPLASSLLIVVVWIVVGRTLAAGRRDPLAGRRDRDGRARPAGARARHRRRDRPARRDDERHARPSRARRACASSDSSPTPSHELRTPLTRMRTELEVDERNPDRADPAATRRSQLDEIAGLQRLIEDLLAAGAQRCRGDRSSPRSGRPRRHRARGGPRRGGCRAVVRRRVRSRRAQVRGDAEALRRVVRNLFDNARQHAAARVSVGLVERDGRRPR